MADLAVTTREANEVYSILVTYCNASERDRENFLVNQTAGFVREWRFQGSLGFGGKLYRTDARGRWRVSMYREDETPSRLLAMELANRELGRFGPQRQD